MIRVSSLVTNTSTNQMTLGCKGIALITDNSWDAFQNPMEPEPLRIFTAYLMSLYVVVYT